MSPPGAIHQFLPTFEPGAIGNHAVGLQRALRSAGFASEIFAEFLHGPFAEPGRGHRHVEYGRTVPSGDNDLLVYHMALGSNVADWLLDRTESVALVHHNITPVEYYEPWDPTVTYGMAWGRDQLRRLAPRATLGIAVSQYNQRELEALHFRRTAEAPILLDLEAGQVIDDAAFDSLSSRKHAEGGHDWLFVGWVAPHKCQHDLIRAFASYRHLYDPKARLHLVGRTGLESYRLACVGLIEALGLESAVRLHGPVSDGELGAHYRNADVLVCLSEHEGVGLPLLEAMAHGVPVVAYGAAAVPETVAGAGLVLPAKRPATVAAAVHRVITDVSLRSFFVARGRRRVAAYGRAAAEGRWLEVFSGIS